MIISRACRPISHTFYFSFSLTCRDAAPAGFTIIYYTDTSQHKVIGQCKNMEIKSTYILFCVSFLDLFFSFSFLFRSSYPFFTAKGSIFLSRGTPASSAEHLSSMGYFGKGAMLEHLNFTRHFLGGAVGGAILSAEQLLAEQMSCMCRGFVFIRVVKQFCLNCHSTAK